MRQRPKLIGVVPAFYKAPHTQFLDTNYPWRGKQDMNEIANAFRGDGVIWMYLILATSIFAIGITIERFIFLFFKYNINAQAFMAQIQKLVMADNIDRAIKLCNARSEEHTSELQSRPHLVCR